MSVIKEGDVGKSSQSAVSTFEDLEVFQRAYRISLEVHRASLNFPEVERYVLADQIRRASKSICGNIAEGFGKQRRSSAEFRRYLLMAIGSADEMRVWLRYGFDLKYIDQETCVRWRDEYRQIARMLQGLYTASSASS
jgi:four helix bundle protein